MKTRLIAAVLVLAFAAVACGQSPAQQLRNVVHAIDHTQSHPHDFVYRDESLDGSQKIVVRGRISDDFLYEGTVALNGKPLYSMIVSDDAVAVKLLDTAATKGVISIANADDPVTAQALAAGKWVVDFTAAPPLNVIAATNPNNTAGSGTTAALSSSQDQIGNDPFFDAEDALHYTERSLAAGGNLKEFNPDDAQYNPADDPWASDAKANLRNEGIVRWDLTQPPLPPPASRGQVQRLPVVSDFRKMALYEKGDRAIEVREQISIRDRIEFRRALVGRAAKYYLKLRDAAENGAIQSPLRERRMDFTIERFTGGPVAIPLDAIHGILKDVVGPAGFPTLFHFKQIGGATGVLPGLAAGTTPGPSAPPTATTSSPKPTTSSPKPTAAKTPAASVRPSPAPSATAKTTPKPR